MTQIIITMNVDGDYADPGHAMGLTEEGYDKLMEALGELGTDIDVNRAPDG